MANYKTGAQRYNDRMDKIFARSEELGHHGLHPEVDNKTKAQSNAIHKMRNTKDKNTLHKSTDFAHRNTSKILD